MPGNDTTQSPLKELANVQFFPQEERSNTAGVPSTGGGAGFGVSGERRSQFGGFSLQDRISGGAGDGDFGAGRGGGGVGAVMEGWEEEFHDFSDVISSQSD